MSHGTCGAEHNAVSNGINAMHNANAIAITAVTSYCNGIGHAFVLHAMALLAMQISLHITRNYNCIAWRNA
jgi:hypothetical protein